MNVDWKGFANWWKLFVALEVAALWFFGNKQPMEAVTIGLFQYGLFFPVDLSILIKNIKGITSKDG